MENKTLVDVIECKFVHHVTCIRGVAFDGLNNLLRLFVGWFENGKTIPRIDVLGGKCVHPVRCIRGVVFVQIYNQLRLFVGWSWSGKQHPTNRHNRM